MGRIICTDMVCKDEETGEIVKFGGMEFRDGERRIFFNKNASKTKCGREMRKLLIESITNGEEENVEAAPRGDDDGKATA